MNALSPPRKSPAHGGLSLRWKLILGCVVVEVVMLTLLVLNSVRLIESSLVEQAELRVKELSVLLEAAIAPSLAAQDYGPILDVFEASRREHGIIYFSLRDNRGRLIARDGWPANQPLPPPSADFDVSTRSERFDTRIPIGIGSQRYGELQFGISTHFLVETRSRLIRQSLLIAGAEVGLSVVLLTLIGIWLTRHLKTLEEASRAISAGNYKVRLEVASDDEIGALSQAFNSMAGEIAAQLDALRKSEDSFRHLSELASDWYWEQDAEFRFTRFTGGSFRNYPEFAQAMLGKRRWESEYIKLSPEAMAAHKATLEAHQPFRDFEYMASDASGKRRWLSINGEPTCDEDGNFTGYRGTGRDISGRKLAEAAMHDSEQKFASLFQFSPLPLALTSLRSNRIADINESWTRLFGYSHADATASSLEVLQLFQYDNERRAFEGLITRYGRCELIEAHLVTRDGRTLNCELTGRTLEIGEERYFLWGVRDVTEQRQIEERVRELNARLEIRVAERTRELQEAMETLRHAQDELVNSEKLAALGRVVAGVAHELNTPIGNSVMVATTLDEKSHELAALVETGNIRRSALNEFVRGCVSGTDMLVRNLQQAHNLIHSFKQVAVDQTSERRREFELRTMVDEVTATMQPMLRKMPYRLTLDVAPGLTMNSYPGPLGQIITNFVNNALLHAFNGRESGTMHLAARYLTDTADTGFVELSFADDGNGMDGEHLKRIFDPFFTTRLGQGGSGLGLNIVYNIATRILGGSIDVSSTPGAGTTFTLLLPKVAPEHAESAR